MGHTALVFPLPVKMRHSGWSLTVRASGGAVKTVNSNGDGFMSLTLGLRFDLNPDRDCAAVWLDAGVGGL